jgi:hypothetical protein
LAEEQEAEQKEQEEMASLEWWETDSSDDEHLVTGGPAPKRLVKWTPPTPPRPRHPFHEQLERDWDWYDKSSDEDSVISGNYFDVYTGLEFLHRGTEVCFTSISGEEPLIELDVDGDDEEEDGE